MTGIMRICASVGLAAWIAGAQPAGAQIQAAAQAASACVIDDAGCLKARALSRVEAFIADPANRNLIPDAQARLLINVRALHEPSQRAQFDERTTRFAASRPPLREALAAAVAEQTLLDSIQPEDLDQALATRRSPDSRFRIQDYIDIGFRGLLQQGRDREAHTLWLRHHTLIAGQLRRVHERMFRRMMQREPAVLASYMRVHAAQVGQGRATLGLLGQEAARRCGQGDKEGGERIAQAMVAALDAQPSTSPIQRGELVEPVLHCIGVDAARDVIRTLAPQMAQWEGRIAQLRDDPQSRNAEIQSMRVAMFDLVARPVAVHLIQLGREAEARAVFDLLPAVASSTQTTLGTGANAGTVTTTRGPVSWDDVRAAAIEQCHETPDLTLLFTAAAEGRIALRGSVMNRLQVVTNALAEAAQRVPAAGRALAARGLARMAADTEALRAGARAGFEQRAIDHALLTLHLARETIDACTLSADQRAGFLQRASAADAMAEVAVLSVLIRRGTPASVPGTPTC